MSDVNIIVGDLLASDADVIAHQCNCVTDGEAKGLAAYIFRKFPWANVYAERAKPGGKPSVPGTSSLHGDPDLKQRLVLNIYSQYYPGRSKFNTDTPDLRLRWFKAALRDFIVAHPGKSIALPYGVGCGLAGGYWRDYVDALREIIAQTGANLVVYRRAQDPLL